MAAKTKIIGIGDDGFEGLTLAARDVISQAEVVLGTSHALAAVESDGTRVVIEGSLDELVKQFEAHQGKRIVLLVGGDPLFYGVARYLADRIGKDAFEVIPHVSSMQLAFARVKESWDDAYLANLATQPLDRVLENARLAEKVGLFTTESCTPQEIARRLIENQVDYFTAYVCENLGSRDERVTQGDLNEIAELTFGPLNVMVLVRRPNVPDRQASAASTRLFGNPDDQFQHSLPKRGLQTQMEVRVIALAEMNVGISNVIWDVGAGSGAVAIEAARLNPNGTVYAIEMDPNDHHLLVENAKTFDVHDNLKPVLGQAPEAWKDLPDPDAVFVGGTGRAVGQIVEDAIQRVRPGGRVVANVSSLDNLNGVYQKAKSGRHEISLRMINIAQSTHQIDQIRFEAMNPTFLITIVKSDK